MLDLGKVLGFISEYQIFGLIPLDLTLHFIIGMLWTIVGLKKNISFGKLTVGLAFIALAKEANDYFFHYKTHWSEYVSDFSVTMLYLVIVYLIRKTKRSLE